eukprot:scaffold61821_cov97-Phaeocystis_antarctica.AAC.1
MISVRSCAYHLNSEGRSEPGDRRAMAQNCARSCSGRTGSCRRGGSPRLWPYGSGSLAACCSTTQRRRDKYGGIRHDPDRWSSFVGSCFTVHFVVVASSAMAASPGGEWRQSFGQSPGSGAPASSEGDAADKWPGCRKAAN